MKANWRADEGEGEEGMGGKDERKGRNKGTTEAGREGELPTKGSGRRSRKTQGGVCVRVCVCV